MTPHFWSLARSSLLAMGLVTGMTAPSLAAPLMPMNQSSSLTTPEIGAQSIQWHRRHGGNNWRGGNWRGGRNWHGNNWRGGNWHGRHWRGNNWRRYGWNDNWRYPYYGGGSSIYFGLGVPYFGLGLGVPYYNYGDPYYYAPRRFYAPRRYYRSGGLSSAHINWCYNRYRSYRSWDNTFQPYNGPRQQCWSPYS